MEGKLIKLELSEGYRLDDLNGNYIASTLNGKNKLSLKNCLAIENGYDLDELALDYYKLVFGNTKSYKDGFQKALELLGDKKFSEEDIKKAFNVGWIQRHNEEGSHYEAMEKVIQSLQQTEWNVIVEMECPECKEYGYISECRNECNKKFTQPKLDAYGCLILKRK